MSRAEQETQTEAGRLTTHIERALSAVTVRSSTETEELDACADALERSARNLVAALRELARERKREQNDEG